VAKAFAYLTLQTMARRSATRDAAGDGKPESGMMCVVWPHHDRHDLHVQPDAAGKDSRKVFPPP